MKKILIVSCVFPPEPVVSAQLSMDIANALSDGNEVTVLSPKPTRPLNFKFENQQPSSKKFKHIVVNSYTCPESKLYGRMKESYSYGRECQKFIERNHHSIDVIYQNSWPMFSQRSVIETAKKFGIPVITHVQDIYPESMINKLPIAKKLFYHLLLPIDKKILQNSEKIICISDNMKRELAVSRKISESKLEVVNNWQNENAFLDYRNNGKSNILYEAPFTFMYLGNNGPLAGVEFLISSFVKAGLPNSRLIIAGSGSKTEDCRSLARKLGAENVEFISVPEGKVPETQDLADVMLLPVKKNGAYSSVPSKLPAYMFSEKAILGSLDVDSDTAKAILDSDSGIVVEPEDDGKLVEAMKEMHSWSKEKLLEKGKNAFNYSMNQFSRKNNLIKVVDIILNT